MLGKLRCPSCQRTLSTYNIMGTLRPEDTRRLQQQLALATQASLRSWPDLPAAVLSLVKVRTAPMHALFSVLRLPCTTQLSLSLQAPKAALAEAPWQHADGLVTAATAGEARACLAVDCAASGPADVRAALQRDRRAAASLRQAGLAAAALALLQRLSALRSGKLPRAEFAPTAAALLGDEDGAPAADAPPGARRRRPQGAASRGAAPPRPSGTGYEGDKLDAQQVAAGMQAKGALRQATFEDGRLTAAALTEVINRSAFQEPGLPVRAPLLFPPPPPGHGVHGVMQSAGRTAPTWCSRCSRHRSPRSPRAASRTRCTASSRASLWTR